MNSKKICDAVCGVHDDHRFLDTGLLILRVVIGIAFIYHGWMKVSNMEGAITMFSSMGIGYVVTYIASYVEFLGGIILVLGVMTRLVGVLLSIFMLAAIYLVHLDKGYNSMSGGYEYQLLLLASVVFIALVGPGKYSLHEKFCKSMK